MTLTLSLNLSQELSLKQVGSLLADLGRYPAQYCKGNSSETESESEFELPPNPSLSHRPGFSLPLGQRSLGSYVLDRQQGTAVPAAINTHLRDYQREGVTFFWERYKEGRGGLLGDDMGLGDKRDIDRRRNHVSKLQDKPDWTKHGTLPLANETWPTCLIVAPSSVVPNWEREIHTWGYFEVGVYGGQPTEREEVLSEFKKGRLDVVITSFDMARRNIDKLEELAWSTIIVDEVHRFKNPSSKGTEAFNQFLCKCRFGLTGTAIQNSYNELWTILDWTNPGQLGTLRQWKGYVVQPLTIGQSSKASEEERTKALVVATVLRDKLLPRFFKRRTKDIIKSQLPTKTDEVVFCPLTPIQITVYKRMLASDDIQRLFNKDSYCTCGSKKKYAYQTKRNRELVQIAFPDETPPKFGTAMLQPQLCGKWLVLDVLLKDWHEEPSNKVLIFTKSVKLLDMLEFHLRANNFGFCKLDGSTKQPDRMPMIDKFNQDPDIYIFLISTLAGGTGLNLTGANKVVIFDPAHDLQAMDRAYRFGQTRDVSVYRLLGAGSIEELIYARQLYKQQQMAIGYTASVQTRYFQGIQGDASRQGELFGIKNIFRLHEDTLATKMAIERANLLELDWALAHLRGKPKRSSSQKVDKWVHDADSKANKEDTDLKGLSALLFDDEIPEIQSQGDVQDTLAAIGVKYSHHNDEVLIPSRIEEERSRNALKKNARAKSIRRPNASSSTTRRDKTPEPVWPPRRRHHKPTLSPNSKLASRQKALVELGMISHPVDLPTFAQTL
ncbi:hypothetical protein CONPUDRAFT_63659 [Coniophora puteana RWD-64-598 SS2]|uniref:P-loop containing nucleoside triphosphate hydrolase protein n=1 Tax=Coniophora puteana (strain RWD-64-598) TaxID=741705 RepID=A0A5M3MCD1_CONPW|nr:uncharacterized protein CONPUDRAFT_63659 [Coniophora puteana RWD-64-598 SS2]EIW76686.1 hypothetical protein CONPUDRAFT_63659 [Coniophora puteana RWD-64-598 SS2]